MTGQIRVRKHDDVMAFVRILGSLAFQGIVNCVFSLQSPVFFGALDAEKSALLDRPSGGSADEWDRYAASKGRPFWTTELRFYGPAKVIACARTGGSLRIAPRPSSSVSGGPPLDQVLIGDGLALRLLVLQGRPRGAVAAQPHLGVLVDGQRAVAAGGGSDQ